MTSTRPSAWRCRAWGPIQSGSRGHCRRRRMDTDELVLGETRAQQGMQVPPEPVVVATCQGIYRFGDGFGGQGEIVPRAVEGRTVLRGWALAAAAHELAAVASAMSARRSMACSLWSRKPA